MYIYYMFLKATDALTTEHSDDGWMDHGNTVRTGVMLKWLLPFHGKGIITIIRQNFFQFFLLRQY